MTAFNAGKDRERFGAVIVFFHPDEECIKQVNRLSRMVGRVIVVDNTPGCPEDRYSGRFLSNVDLLRNSRNVGIATALNRGINALMLSKHQFAFLFDQDSVASQELIDGIISYFTNADSDKKNVALAGPTYFDARFGQRASFIRFAPFQVKRIEPCGEIPIDVDFLITSGSCIDLQYWNKIGPMEDDLFIDLVDMEWCLRAKKKGVRIVGLPWLTLTHNLGEKPIRLGWKYYPQHNIIRRYYQVRNVVNLLLRREIAWIWKSRELLFFPIRIMIYALCSSGSVRSNYQMIRRAISDGIKGRLGPLS